MVQKFKKCKISQENNMETSSENLQSTLDTSGNKVPVITNLGLADGTSNPLQVKQINASVSPQSSPFVKPQRNPPTFDPKAQIAAMQEWHDSTVNSQQDNNEWSKVSSYDSGPSGTFYDRYADLQDYGKVEFHPTRNNEAILNRNTSFAGDLYRTTTQALLPMIWNGVKSTFASTAKIFNEGDFFGADQRLARDYARITAKNSSSKDNLGSFVNNLTLNLGYTIGIMGTALFENWAGAAVGGLTGAKAISTKSANLLFKEYQAGKAIDGLGSYTQMLDELKDINVVRQQWEKANGIGKAQKFMQSAPVRALNPLSNLTDNAYSILNSTDDFTGYMKSGRQFMNTAGAAYRDFRNINLAVAEARLESGMVYNTMFDDLYREHQIKFGKNPDEKELQDIITQSRQAAYETSFMNAGLIYATNKISFDNILNPRIGTQGFLKQRMLDWKTIGGGRFGELGTIAFDVAKNEWKFGEKGFKTWWNGWKTDPFHKSVWGTVGYFKRNIFEGVQESLQETISSANEKYYKDSFYSTPVRKNLVSKAAFGKGTTPMSYYGEGVKEQFSKEGLATFASGFAMGSLAGGLNSSMTFLYEKANQIFDPKTYEVYKTEKSKIVDDLVTQMNAFGIEEMINSRLFNGGTQDILAKVQESGNKKEVMDAESEALVQHFSMLHEYGVLDMYLDAVESYSKYNDPEFKEAFPKVADGDISKYRARIPEVVNKARAIKDRLETYNKIYPNPIDLSKMNKDDADYEEAYIMHHSWNWGIKSAVFYNEVFDDARDRMVKIMNKHYQERPLQSMTKRQSDVILRPEQMRNEMGLLKNEADSLLAVGDAESKKVAKEKLKQIEAYAKYVEAYDEFSEYYHRDRYFNRAKSIVQSEKAEGEQVTDEEVDQYLEDRFGPKNAETEQEILLNLEKQYNNLLKSISGKPDDYLFTNKVDEGFELVLDFYKLNDESREMVDVINLMNDPKGFLDVYYKNEKWMTDLWLKRGDYYRDIVTQELSQIEDNGLLNYLANQGIYMNANDFILYRDQDIPPKEFYDEKKQLVIPEGSLAYDRYYAILNRYKGLKTIEGMARKQAMQAELEVRIAQLAERRDKEIERLGTQFEENLVETTGETREAWEKKEPATTQGRTQEQIDEDIKGLKANLQLIEDAESIDEIYQLYEAFAEQELIPENYFALIDEAMVANEKEAKKFFKSTKDSGADVETRQKATQHKITLPQVLKDKIAAVTSEEAVTEVDDTRPIENTEAWKDYQKQVKTTTERYQTLIDKLKAERIDSEEEVPRPPSAPAKRDSKKDVDLNAPWNELPEDLKNELQEAFNIFLTSPAPEGLGKPADLQRINPMQYEMLRNNWLEQQKGLIDDYNNRAVDEKSAQPEIKYLTLKKTIDKYGLTQLRAMTDELQSMLDRNSNYDGTALTNLEKADMKNDVKELQKYIVYRRANYMPKDNTERVFRIFEEMVVNKQNGVSRILDAAGNTTGYEFPGQDGKPLRVTKVTEEIEIKMTGKEPYLYDGVKETYIGKDGKPRGGQLLNLFRELKNDDSIKTDADRLNLFMSSLETTLKDNKLPQLKSQKKVDAIRKALTNNFTEQTLIAVVKDVAHSESTTAGNTLDTMTRDSFKTNSDGGFVKPEKPARMAQDAYDNLFGDFGVITQLQDSVIDGKYEILSSDVIIYDPTLLESGLVGAMDLIAFDKTTGDIKIIDIKTGKPENWKNFDTESEYSKKLNYRLQQSIYRALLFNMTGILAKSISILPIAITTDMEGNILSAESAAKVVNGNAIRELKTKKLTLENASKPDVDKINTLEKQIKELEKATTVPLLPVEDSVLAENGIVMKAPNLPENLKPEGVGEKASEPNLTEEQKKTEIKRLKSEIAKIDKKLAGLKDGGIINVGDMVTTSPAYDKLINKRKQFEDKLSEFETKENKEKDEDEISDEIKAMKKGVKELFPQPETITSEIFKSLLAKIRNSQTLADLENAYNDAIVEIIGESDITFNDMVENVYEIRKLALNVDTSQEENINKGDYLISKNPIFTGSVDEIVVVKKVADGKVTIKELEGTRQKTFTIAQIAAGFSKTTEDALKIEQEETMGSTPDEKLNSTISKNSLEEFSKNADLIDKAKQNIGTSRKDRLAALKNASKDDNINNCKPK
jgi:hypothetical protein